MKRSRGFTLAELLLLVVVLAIGLAGIVSVYTTTVAGSADPLVRKQAMALAESLMEEIMLQAYQAGTAHGATRDTFDEVMDYDGYSTSGGVVNIYGAPIAGLSGYDYTPAVTVQQSSINSVPAANSRLVTVNVTGPGGFVFTLQGYKLNYP